MSQQVMAEAGKTFQIRALNRVSVEAKGGPIGASAEGGSDAGVFTPHSPIPGPAPNIYVDWLAKRDINPARNSRLSPTVTR